METILKVKDEVENAHLVLDEVQASDSDTRERIKHASKKLANVVKVLDAIIIDRNTLISNREKEHNDK